MKTKENMIDSLGLSLFKIWPVNNIYNMHNKTKFKTLGDQKINDLSNMKPLK